MRQVKVIFVILVFCMLIYSRYRGLSADGLPQIEGKMVYHAYSSYDATDSKIYLYDFQTNLLTCLNQNFKGVYHTMNASFSSDGKSIVFMGLVKNQKNEEWDIFTYNLQTRKLTNLTEGNGLRDEDPKYSLDDQKVVFKQGYWDNKLGQIVYDIKEINLKTGVITSITNDTEEEAMPHYSQHSKSVYYMRGNGTDTQIYNRSIGPDSIATEIYGEIGVVSYYPIVYQDVLYFTKWNSASNPADMIIKMDLNTGMMEVLPFNNPAYDYSDPAPISERFIIMSSTMPGGHGGYDLYLADTVSGKVWSLDVFNSKINDKRQQLGASSYITAVKE